MMNIFVIILVLAMCYIGVLRKFFSSLLHMACVVAAGAIAFALWEPLSYLILSKSPSRNFFEFVEYGSWAIGLIIPFAVSLAVLRVATDKLAPANAVAAPVPDAIGGAICGAVSGIITAGIIVIAVGTMQFKPSDFGYAPVRYEGSSLERSRKLLLPVDKLVGGFYAQTSEASFATSKPLAKWRPEPWHPAEVMRITSQGAGRNTAKPIDYSLSGRYRVEAAGGEHLLKDRWDNIPHNATMLDGKAYPEESRIEAVILKLNSSLRERGSAFIALTEAQIWMVAEDASTGTRINLHPVAAIANPQGAEMSLGRFPYDSPDFAISSAGAGTLPWAFEFVVPNEYEPIALYLRNVRQLLTPQQEATEFGSVADRDEAIVDGSLISGAAVYEAIEGPDSVDPNSRDYDEYDHKGISARNNLPGRRSIQKGSHKNTRLDDDNHIMEVDNTWTPAELSKRIVEKALRIERFGAGDNVMVQVDVAGDKMASMYGQAMATVRRTMAPRLVDIHGTGYDAVGWMYEDRDKVHIRFTPGEPIKALSQLADEGIVLSSSRTDQRLTLLFLCTYESEIQSFNVGNQVVFSLDTPLLLDKKQR